MFIVLSIMICSSVDGSYGKGLNYWFARDFMVAMLLIKKKSISLPHCHVVTNQESVKHNDRSG